jgi:single-strand DNA-binding protein
MTGVNRVILVGHLGKDPDLKGEGENRAAILSVATSDSWRDKATGERSESTEWHRVVAFSKSSVEFAEKYLHKGMKVYVEGQNATRRYTKDGTERWITEVVIKPFRGRIESLEKIEGAGGPREDNYGAKRGDLDADIPF